MFPDAKFGMHKRLTPREIRALTLSALEPEKEKGGLLWDVGAGTGAVAIEWVAAQSGNRAVAIERDPDFVALLKANVQLLHEVNCDPKDIEIIPGDASLMLGRPAKPNAIFFGCPTDVSLDIAEGLYTELKAGGRFVCNATRESSVRQVEAMLCNHSDAGHVLFINLSKDYADGWSKREKIRHQLVLTKTQ